MAMPWESLSLEEIDSRAENSVRPLLDSILAADEFEPSKLAFLAGRHSFAPDVRVLCKHYLQNLSAPLVATFHEAHVSPRFAVGWIGYVFGASADT